MSKPTIYYHPISPPSRMAVIVAREIGLDCEIKEVNLLGGEHFSKAYEKINPTGTVPALIDGDLKVFDSHAIAIYLIEKYAKNDALYPKDLVQRTKINEKLFYDASYLFPRGYQIFIPVMMMGETEISEIKVEGILKGYANTEKFLEASTYLAGDTMTLADLSYWTMTESMMQVIPIDPEKFPKIHAWLERLRQLPYYEELNKRGADSHIEFFNKCLAKNKAQLAK